MPSGAATGSNTPSPAGTACAAGRSPAVLTRDPIPRSTSIDRALGLRQRAIPVAAPIGPHARQWRRLTRRDPAISQAIPHPLWPDGTGKGTSFHWSSPQRMGTPPYPLANRRLMSLQFDTIQIFTNHPRRCGVGGGARRHHLSIETEGEAATKTARPSCLLPVGQPRSGTDARRRARKSAGSSGSTEHPEFRPAPASARGTVQATHWGAAIRREPLASASAHGTGVKTARSMSRSDPPLSIVRSRTVVAATWHMCPDKRTSVDVFMNSCQNPYFSQFVASRAESTGQARRGTGTGVSGRREPLLAAPYSRCCDAAIPCSFENRIEVRNGRLPLPGSTRQRTEGSAARTSEKGHPIDVSSRFHWHQ